ncbi:MAG: ABC transporter ATP-binding protein [Flavobacteriaceae bacterium]|nr:ABC transporter ATP-binding protein [Flavobacteriaceae bacterium]MBL6684079.1 ABC transporter ATP-binding protein [Flavobacteriaceae bacterium]
MKELRYLNKFFLKYRNRIIIGIIITIIARIFALIAPNIVGDSITLIENYFLDKSIENDILKKQLLINIFLIIGSAFLAGIFTFLMRQTLINVSRFIEFDLKNEIYNKYQELDQKFYKNNRTGDLMNRISEDVSKVRMYVGPALMYTINTISLFVIIISYMISIAPALTLYTIIPLPILSFLIFKLSKKINVKSKKVQESLSRITTYTQESFSGISVIKSNTIQNEVINSMMNYSYDTKQKNIDLAKFQSWFFPMMILLIGISNIIVIFIGGKQYINGEIDLGVLAEFIIYVTMLTWPVATVGWVTSIVQQAEASQKRINEFLNEKSNIKNNANDNYNLKGEIEFNNVSLIYPETKIVAINNLSFKIDEGKSLGIIGGVGSGKSTIAELILRNYDPVKGEVFIDKKSLKKHNLDIIRQNIGYVPQTTFLFSDSILNNIKFGNIHASSEDVIRFSKFANVHEDINSFYNKYNSILGERGINLSGGQRQRIAIARALIKEPKIIILDDSLSAVDTETEDKIFRNILNDISNCTKIIISHRISTVKHCDKIIVLNEGKKIQEGSHSELIIKEGYYKDIYNQQIEGK